MRWRPARVAVGEACADDSPCRLPGRPAPDVGAGPRTLSNAGNAGCLPDERFQVRPDGAGNPLGPRALYLYKDGRDTLYRLHGTTEPWTIGTSVSSGCIRMINQDVMDLYLRIPEGTQVVVLGTPIG